MRAIVLLSVPLLGLSLAAQTPDRNFVFRHNQNYLLIGRLDPVSNRNFLPPTISPAEYTNPTVTTGVPAGTKTWRWFPYATNARKETRMLSGMQTSLHVSPSTVTFPHTGYRWGVNFHAARARTGGGFDPDFSVGPLVTIAQGTYTWATPTNIRINTTFSTPIPLAGDEVIMALNWRGGEHELTPGSQAHYGSARENTFTPMSWGFASPTGTLTYASGTNSVPIMCWAENAPVIQAKSDWGESRGAPATPSYEGTGMGTAQADLANLAGQVAWQVHGGVSRANQIAVPLLNVGPIFPISLPIFGQTLEVNPADPAFGALMSGYTLQLDANGLGTGPYIPVGPFGSSSIGLHIGVEFVTINPTVPAFTGSTQAYYILIHR